MYHVSVSIVLLQCLCFTHYWKFSLAQRSILLYPKPEIKDDSCLCPINVTDKSLLSFSHPLFLEPTTGLIMYPQPGSAVINVLTGDTVMLHCPGVECMLVTDEEGGNTQVAGPVLLAKCLYEQRWQFEQLNNFESELKNVECKGKIKTWARLGTTPCAENAREIQTGFRLESGKYVSIMGICFNYVNKHPVYAHTYISKGITPINSIEDSDFDDSVRKTFSGEFYRLYTNFGDLYSRNVVRASINKQLGLGKFDVKYVGLDRGYTLIITLLLSHINFLYPFEKRATYYYINTTPMWKTQLTTGWEMLEVLFRQYTAIRKRDLDVMAGTYGYMKLPHNLTNECKPMYLHYAVQAGLIPIPALLWRTAIDLRRDAGIAIIVVNNPFEVCLEDDICPDISETTPWLQPIKNVMYPMKVYACTIEEFKKTIGKRILLDDIANVLDLTLT